jgi:hypothetical protein
MYWMYAAHQGRILHFPFAVKMVVLESTWPEKIQIRTYHNLYLLLVELDQPRFYVGLRTEIFVNPDPLIVRSKLSSNLFYVFSIKRLAKIRETLVNQRILCSNCE